MPYSIFKKGSKYCVRNKDTGEAKGCSDSRDMAIKHMRALYAAEGKASKKEVSEQTVELFVKEAVKEFEQQNPDDCPDCEDSPEDSSTKETATKSYYGWSPATSYAELDALENAYEMRHEADEMINRFPMLASNIMESPTVEDKAKAIETLAKELSDRLNMLDAEEEHAKKEGKPSWFESLVARVKAAVNPISAKEKPAEEPQEKHAGFMIWKEANGDIRWLARYSNSFRDRDNPPEIISAESHRRFVDKVEKGLAPLPELMIWHRPEWKIGQSDWVAFDEVKDVSFALAGGYIYPQFSQVAEWLSTKTDALVSHGMPPHTIIRDENDPTVIIEHETREISPLPAWAAANVLTGFYVFENDENKEAEMPIPADKRKALIEQWGMPEGLLSQVETANAKTADKAIDAGLESKETDAVVETTAQVAEAVTEPVTEPVATEPAPENTPETSQDYPTRKEIAEAVAAVIGPIYDEVKEMHVMIDELKSKLEVKETIEQKAVKEVVANTPLASLTALLAQSVIGNPEARVDGRSPLAKDHPKETRPMSGGTGVPMLDRLIQPSQES
jgi:hypothetical protein